MSELRLGVNVDHVATIRQARGTSYPDPIEAALAAEKGGAQGITAHLREDRRHINDDDIRRLAESVGTKLNLELATAEDVLAVACEVAPEDCCIVPEKREELTTEGGLAVAGNEDRMRDIVARLADAGIRVSLFIEPDRREIDAAVSVGAPVVELHTGAYADAPPGLVAEAVADSIATAAAHAAGCGLVVNAGHGLTVANVDLIAAIPEMEELNIGHSIVARAMMLGMEAATREMLEACRRARGG